MRGMPFHKSLIDQASSVQISGYSKKANALIQLTIYDKENDPILEWGQSMYQSLAATTNSLSRTQWEGLRVGQFLHWRFLIFFRKVVHKRQPTKLGFSSPLLNTTTWLWTFTSTWHLNIAWKRLSLYDANKWVTLIQLEINTFKGLKKLLTGLCLSLDHSICLTIKFKLNLSFENCYNTYETHSSE